MISDALVGGMLLALFGGIALSNLRPWWRRRQERIRQDAADWAEHVSMARYLVNQHPEILK